MSGYLHFDGTGDALIDAVLGAVEYAGDMYHGTERWGDADRGEKSQLDLIQDAANKAADEIANLRAQLAVATPVVEAAKVWARAKVDPDRDIINEVNATSDLLDAVHVFLLAQPKEADRG